MQAVGPPAVHQLRDEVDARLDGEHEAGLEAPRQPQIGEPELRRPLLPELVADDVAEVLHVVDIEAHHVSEPVHEEHRVRARLDRRLRIPLHEAEVLEAGGDGPRRQQVELAVGDPGRGGRDRRLVGRQHDLVDVALLLGVPAGDRHRAGDVRRVAARRLGAAVDQQQVAL